MVQNYLLLAVHQWPLTVPSYLLWLLLISVVAAALLRRCRLLFGNLQLSGDLDHFTCYDYCWALSFELCVGVLGSSDAVMAWQTGLQATTSVLCLWTSEYSEPFIFYDAVSYHSFYFGSVLSLAVGDCTSPCLSLVIRGERSQHAPQVSPNERHSIISRPIAPCECERKSWSVFH